MLGEHVTVVERVQRLKPKTIDVGCDSLNVETPEAWLVIDCVLTSFVNILKLCHVSSRVNGDEYDWIQIMEDVEEMPASRSCSRCRSSATLAFGCGC
jgi:hypothetical protein